jgi:hypothetical protein
MTLASDNGDSSKIVFLGSLSYPARGRIVFLGAPQDKYFVARIAGCKLRRENTCFVAATQQAGKGRNASPQQNTVLSCRIALQKRACTQYANF